MIDMKKVLKTLLSLLWLVACLGAACFFIYRFSGNFIDSDISSELVLAKLLSQEENILSKNWFYSTEIKVFNDQLIFAPLFLVFESWQMVRTVGSAIILALMLIAYIYLARSLHISWALSFFSAGVLCLPLSAGYTYGVLTGIFYAPYVFFTFLTLAFLVRAANVKKGFRYFICLLFACAASFASALAGVRQIFVFALPAAVAAVMLLFTHKGQITKQDGSWAFAKAAVLSCIAGAGGYYVNKTVLLANYSFCDYGFDTFGRDLLFTEFSIGGVETFLNNTFEMLGYRTGGLFSGYIIYNALFALLLLLSVVAVLVILRRSEYDAAEKGTALTFVFGLLLIAGVTCFTDMDKLGRYAIPVMALLVPVITILLNRWEADRRLCGLLVVVMAGLFAVTSANTYRINAQTDANVQLKDVYEYLSEKDYTEGYSSFWSGNVLTELSDGKIDMRVVGTDYILKNEDFGNVYHWLQLKEHEDIEPKGKFFVLLTKPEAKKCDMPSEPEYENDRYYVYGFEKFEDYEKLYE